MYKEYYGKWIPCVLELPKNGTRVIAEILDESTNIMYKDIIWYLNGLWWEYSSSSFKRIPIFEKILCWTEIP